MASQRKKPKGNRKRPEPEFDIALSFAGEDRKYVEEVADTLRKMGFKIFYDKYEAVTLWGKDLYRHLRKVYYEQSRYTVIFVSKHYRKKLWANHELESAQARAFQENREYILPVRFDQTEIPGLLDTIGYVSLSVITPDQLAQMIKHKIGPLHRKEFFPDDPDRLFEYIKINKRSTRKRTLVRDIAYGFFRNMKLMTYRERYILTNAVAHTCPCGPPDDIHLSLNLLSRYTSSSTAELKSTFSRLDCLGIRTSVAPTDTDDSELDCLDDQDEIISIIYDPAYEYFSDNATFVMIGIFECLFDLKCADCADKAIELLDFSFLSTLSANPIH